MYSRTLLNEEFREYIQYERRKNMKFGFFDDPNKEYVITTPKTPLPWINYLGSNNFFSLISNTCGGYSFYKDAKLLRITRYRYNNIPTDEGGRYYYIKDGDTVWNPGWQPVKTNLDSYECRHGMGYSRFTSSKNDIEASLLAFVPVNDNCEVNQLKITNKSSKPKTITLFSYVEFCLWNAMDDMTNFQRNLNIGEVEVVGSTIYHKTEYRERRNHFAVYSVNADVDGFDTSNAEDFHGMFQGCIKLTQLNVKHFNVDNVLHMSCLFSKCLRLKVIDLESWNFSQVSDANEMFAYCEKLEKIIANFNFKMIKEMAFMFCYCTKLSKVDLSHSDLSHVFDFGYTFFKCEGLKDIRFSQGVWLKAKFTLSMFDDCKALERLNLPDVILDDVIRSYAMFDDCDNLKEIYMEHPLNLDKYEHELIFGNCKAEVKKSTEWQ